MSEELALTGDEALAAEFALGLIEGDALAAARRRADDEPGFARLVQAWEARLCPLLDEIAPVEPDANLWPRIRAALFAGGANDNEVVTLHRRIRLWRGYGAGITALAASLALAIGLERTRTPETVVVSAAPTSMVATLESADGPSRLVAAWEPDSHSLLVTPALLTAAAGHNHELWLIPTGGAPRSLGVVRTGAAQRVVVPAAWTPDIGEAASLAVSVEPVGGSPTGQPTGPVIAAGHLRPI